METVYLDTHVAIWIYAGQIDRLPRRVLDVLETADKRISPMVLLEIQLLKEIGKLEFKVDRFLRDMSVDMGIKLCDTSFASVMLESSRMSWTRDPFDRVIVAHAANNESRLVTRDKAILEHYRRAFWG